MTDIVQRLRDACEGTNYNWQIELHNEAADEIEALRKDAAEASTLIESLAREVVYLRHYGNKDCTHMADEAMKRSELEEQTP